MKRDPLVRLPPALTVPPASSQTRYVLGLDGGATKTLAAVLDLHDNTLYLGHGGPSNLDSVGARGTIDALLGAADEAMQSAGIGEHELGAAVLAVAGTDTEAIVAHLHRARSEAWIVVNDVVAAWAAATGGGPGVAAISGTGSNVFGVGPGSRPWRAGGWGHLLGDQGSGYWLGLHSIRAALHDRDRSGPETGLGDAAMAFFHAPSIEELAARVYAQPLTKGQIAAFAIETATLARAGDSVARELYERAAKDLGQQIAAVIRETGLDAVRWPDSGGRAAGGRAAGGRTVGGRTAGRRGAGGRGAGEDGPRKGGGGQDGGGGTGEVRTGGGDARPAATFPVGLTGSALKAGEVFLQPLCAFVGQFAPQARVSVVRLAPVGGSLLLAARACGRAGSLDPDELTPLLDSAVHETS